MILGFFCSRGFWFSLVRFFRGLLRPGRHPVHRTRYFRPGLEVLELRLAPAQYRLPYMDFSPYLKPGENPNMGPGQISVQQLTKDMKVIAPDTQGTRTYGCTGDLKPAGQIAHSLGLKAAIGAWIGPDPAANQAEIDSLVAQAIKGNVDVAV